MGAYYTDLLLIKLAQSHAFIDFVHLVNTVSGAYNKGCEEGVR